MGRNYVLIFFLWNKEGPYNNVPCSVAKIIPKNTKKKWRYQQLRRRNSPRELGDLAYEVQVGSGPVGGRVNMNESHVVPKTDLLLALGNALLLVSLDAIFECSLLAMTFNAEVRRRTVGGAALQKSCRGGLVLDGDQ